MSYPYNQNQQQYYQGQPQHRPPGQDPYRYQAPQQPYQQQQWPGHQQGYQQQQYPPQSQPPHQYGGGSQQPYTHPPPPQQPHQYGGAPQPQRQAPPVPPPPTTRPGEMPPENWLKDVFNRVDRDRSGQITAIELQSALSNGTWQPFNPETCRLMIGMFDTNQDGGINFQEFSSLWKYITQWTHTFRGFDKDNSGNIDKKELSDALTQFGYRLSDNFHNLMITKFDRTKTGRINFDDFIQLLVSLQTLTAAFRDKDTDRDGVITIGYEEFLTMVYSLKMVRLGNDS